MGDAETTRELSCVGYSPRAVLSRVSTRAVVPVYFFLCAASLSAATADEATVTAETALAGRETAPTGAPGVDFPTADFPTADFPTADYHAVFNYHTIINAPPEQVLPHVLKMGAWIDFDFISVAGEAGAEGEIFRLYEGQEFYFQTVKIVPNKLYVGVNLPSTVKGEASSGIAVTTLTELGDTTLVNVTMSRQYTWLGAGEGPLRKVRTSADFETSTRDAWEGKFLPRLRELAEAPAQLQPGSASSFSAA